PVVAAAWPIRSEVLWRAPMLDQVAPGWAILGDAAGWRDMVGGHAVAQQRQHARALDRAQRRRLASHASEVRRVLNVGRVAVPGVQVAARHRDGVPLLVAVEDV